MPELHAKLSPSAGERWFNCPGSVVLAEGLPGKTSVHAEEGIRAHDMGESILKNKPLISPDPEMLKNVRVYTEFVEDLYNNGGGLRMVEKRVDAAENVWGTADAIVWQPDTATLHVVDLKYGIGVGVEVRGNLQLKIYALAALLTLKLPAKTICVSIVQPRHPHPDGPIRTVEYDAVDLLDFHADLSEAILKVTWANNAKLMKDKPEWIRQHLFPSEKACHWCLAAPTCPKLREKSMDLAKAAFTPGTVYDAKQLSHVLDNLGLMESWIKNVREFAASEAEQGRTPPGYKLVAKRATRRWKTDEGAASVLIQGEYLSQHELYETKIISPAGVEKILGKTHSDILESLTTKESSGYSLVPESDKRIAVRVDAQSAFSVVKQ